VCEVSQDAARWTPPGAPVDGWVVAVVGGRHARIITPGRELYTAREPLTLPLGEVARLLGVPPERVCGARFRAVFPDEGGMRDATSVRLERAA